ncbi:hypothetical protein CJ739_1471 [Mariniflexile rhizosphaerae]|uniref:hypothetical protein n=1 Tax=unclassified Mariniflexile TaxID=2643887 RepID=UPI000CB9FCAA|nr:hypothetical protein [Mariniflexile sp. TRM1-10]AXP80560.1 hypothetical protein CJ739_1471 [Mariniflexile sp. TRM1-10]PLB20103.1 MAG: Membrane protein [Flavobacteriaceae bacterium FS1-H7996/R]
MRKLLIVNILTIASVSIVTYFIYISILQYIQAPILQNQILLAYVINTILAIGIMSFMFLFKKRFKDQLGFIFMLGSFIKFACFFVFFYPAYNSDGDITRDEFLSFFIPYSICLITETVTSIRLLNRLDANE